MRLPQLSTVQDIKSKDVRIVYSMISITTDNQKLNKCYDSMVSSPVIHTIIWHLDLQGSDLI